MLKWRARRHRQIESATFWILSNFLANEQLRATFPKISILLATFSLFIWNLYVLLFWTFLHYASPFDIVLFHITLDFNLLFKKAFECLFVTLECSLQSSEIRFEVRSDDLRRSNFVNSNWLVKYASQSNRLLLYHRKSSEWTSKRISELCSEHSKVTNKRSNAFLKSKLKSRVIGF
jgi:hypothetical protein